MIDRICSKLTDIIKRNVEGISEEKAQIINYSLNVLLFDFFVYAIVFLIGAFFHVLTLTIISIVVSGVLRISAGGAHKNTRTFCLLLIILSIFGCIALAHNIHLHSFYVGMVIYCIEVLIAHAYAPADTVEKPIVSQKHKTWQKIISMLEITLLAVCTIPLWNVNQILYNTILLSTLLPIFSITPIGYRLLGCKRSCDPTLDIK